MSSLAATQADGYYLPPEYYDTKLSKNEWHRRQQQQAKKSSAGSSSAQKQSNKSDEQQLQVVHFELPFDGICQGCHRVCSKGSRYNAATKRHTGEWYHSTPIWEFRGKCGWCQMQEWVIRTDPQFRSFRYVEGLQEKASEQQRSNEEQTNPLERLEAAQWSLHQAERERQELIELQESQQAKYADDADRNAQLRAKYRQRKNDDDDCTANITIEDQVEAQTQTYGATPKVKEAARWSRVKQSSIFGKTAGAGMAATTRGRVATTKQRKRKFG